MKTEPMKSNYVPSEWEQKLYEKWEKDKVFEAKTGTGKETFSIILPPPNANASLHVGHAMYVYEDIMIRYNKLKGKEVLWLPGADHAGFETQFVYEKHLNKQGKSRFDFSREHLFKDIWDFVMQNRTTMENQLRRLGFALDWSKKKFTMDEDIVRLVHKTFKRMFDDGLIYRDLKLVNYCTFDGTSFSDLEVVYDEKASNLWYIRYPLEKLTDSDSDEFVVVATTRPETMLGDSAVAVNPKDARYIHLVGRYVVLPLSNRRVKIISDELVDPEFGTGAVKMTPAHDPNDWEAGKRHDLEFIQVIGFDGKMTKESGADFEGLYIKQARTKVVEMLTAQGFLEKTENYMHRVGVCYKCNNPIQPLPKEQWFIKVRPLADEAIKAVESGEMKLYPARFKKIMIDWLNKFHDWNISRQIVWGIRIPAYFSNKENKWYVYDETPSAEEIDKLDLVQDTDTFDTWFSSSQWPFVTLQTQEDAKLYEEFYPTTVMETGYDILPAWVVRMAMVGLYTTGKVPFKNIFLHGMVRDKKGQKMSKSKGNVVNPMDMVDKYGADALRATLVFQSSEGGDVNFSEDKITGMRNFANKIWNIGRYIHMSKNEPLKTDMTKATEPKNPAETIKDPQATIALLKTESAEVFNKAEKDIDQYRFSQAFNDLYEFLWHRYADFFLEELKDSIRSGNIGVLEDLENIYSQTLRMLHPFMPFVTEAVWKSFYGEEDSILNEITA